MVKAFQRKDSPGPGVGDQTPYEVFPYICSPVALDIPMREVFLLQDAASNVKYDSMSIVKTVLSNMLEEEPFLLVAVRSILFLMFFLISVYLSFDRDMLLFWLTTGGMAIYALLIIGVLVSQSRKRKKKTA